MRGTALLGHIEEPHSSDPNQIQRVLILDHLQTMNENAVRTSKIPVWLKEVEEVCAIEPGDPCVKDYRINLKKLQ